MRHELPVAVLGPLLLAVAGGTTYAVVSGIEHGRGRAPHAATPRWEEDGAGTAGQGEPGLPFHFGLRRLHHQRGRRYTRTGGRTPGPGKLPRQSS